MDKKEDIEFLKKLINQPELLAELEKKDPGISAKISGVLLRPWLPYDWGRRIIMLIIFLVAIVGTLFSLWFLLLLFLIPLFSPRCVGEIAMFIGRSKGN